MQITYYDQVENDAHVIATFGVYIKEWDLYVDNLAVLKSKGGGWYIVPPSYKNRATGEYGKTVRFGTETQLKFLLSARKAVEDYAFNNGDALS